MTLWQIRARLTGTFYLLLLHVFHRGGLQGTELNSRAFNFRRLSSCAKRVDTGEVSAVDYIGRLVLRSLLGLRSKLLLSRRISIES